jgi:hypothetical protein
MQRMIRTTQGTKPTAGLAALIRQRNRKVWGERHPLDVDFNGQEERNDMKQLRRSMRADLFTDTLHELHEAMQRDAQDDVNQSDARMGDAMLRRQQLFPMPAGPEGDIGTRNIANHNFALRPDHFNPFSASLPLLQTLTDTHAALRQDIPLPAQQDTTVSAAVRVLQQVDTTSTTLDPEQEAIVRQITDYVSQAAHATGTDIPQRLRLVIHAGPGTGKSTLAREVYQRLSATFGPQIMRFMAPSGVAACNLHGGSTCHHAVGLTVYGDGGSADGWREAGRDKLHRLRNQFHG